MIAATNIAGAGFAAFHHLGAHNQSSAGAHSPETGHRAAAGVTPARDGAPTSPARVEQASATKKAGNGTTGPQDPNQLSEEEQKQVQELKRRDAEVRAHEQAHAMVGGAHAGAPSYEYTTGPDGKRYAIGGEVQIDASPEKTPEATIRKMEIVIRAALAPAEPSPQDRQVAQKAQQQRAQAQIELAKQREAERNGEASDGGGLLNALKAAEQETSSAASSLLNAQNAYGRAQQQTTEIAQIIQAAA